jgi:hypothetical protein
MPSFSKVTHYHHFIFIQETESYRNLNGVLFHWLYSPSGPWPLFSFLIYSQLVGLLERVISPSQGRYLNTGQHKHRINTYTTY